IASSTMRSRVVLDMRWPKYTLSWSQQQEREGLVSIRGVMMPERRTWSIALAAFLACTYLSVAAVAVALPTVASPTLSLRASFSPDSLGASTNLSLSAKLVSSTAVPPAPITKFTLYAPAGIGVDLRGAGACTAAILEQRGPSGCPANSRAGFGGGIGALELPKETTHVPYTLDFFFAPKANGKLRLLV